MSPARRFNEAAAIQLRNREPLRTQILTMVASMRPQLFSCGIPSSFALSARASSSFNEAAAIQLRNPPPRTSFRKVFRRFNEAAAIQLRNPARKSRSLTSKSCFNEAAAIQLRNPGMAQKSVENAEKLQ